MGLVWVATMKRPPIHRRAEEFLLGDRPNETIQTNDPEYGDAVTVCLRCVTNWSRAGIDILALEEKGGTDAHCAECGFRALPSEPVEVTIRFAPETMQPTTMRLLCADFEQQRALEPRAAFIFEQLEELARRGGS